MDLTKLVVLNSEEEYYDWLLDRQLTGIILLAVANVIMLGCYAGAHVIANPFSSIISSLGALGGIINSIVGSLSGVSGASGTSSSVQRGPETVYGVVAASISVAVAIAADVTTFIGHEDMEALAEASWYLQLVQVIMTNLTTIFGFVVVFMSFYTSYIQNTALKFSLLGAGIFVGIVIGIPGSYFIIASAGLMNYTLYGVEGEFDGQEIQDE